LQSRPFWGGGGGGVRPHIPLTADMYVFVSGFERLLCCWLRQVAQGGLGHSVPEFGSGVGSSDDLPEIQSGARFVQWGCRGTWPNLLPPPLVPLMYMVVPPTLSHFAKNGHCRIQRPCRQGSAGFYARKQLPMVAERRDRNSVARIVREVSTWAGPRCSALLPQAVITVRWKTQ